MKHTKSIVCVWAATLSLGTTAARADVVVIMSAKSAVTTLTKEEVASLYLGKTRTFPNGGQAVMTMLASGGAKDEFFSKVLGKTDAQARSIWSRLIFAGDGVAPRSIDNPAELKQLVANNPNIIGFIDKSAVDDGVKIVLAP